MAKAKAKKTTTASDAADETLADALSTLRDCTKRVHAMLRGKKYDLKIASHLAWMTEMLHKIAAREQKAFDRLTVEVLLDRIRNLEKAERAHIATEIQRMNEGGRLFG